MANHFKKYTIFLLCTALLNAALFFPAQLIAEQAIPAHDAHEAIQSPENHEPSTEIQENDTQAKKPTMLESWRKVVTLRWKELGSADAWNIGAPIASIATLGVLGYFYWPKNIIVNNNAHNPDDNNPDDNAHIPPIIPTNNGNDNLTILPNETLNEIFSHCLIEKNMNPTPPSIDSNEWVWLIAPTLMSLRESIKSYMKISIVCKKFNTLLTFKKIGNFCKNYAQDDKNRLLRQILVDHTTGPFGPPTQIGGYVYDNTTYKIKRLPALILMHTNAGSIAEYNHLLRQAVHYNDIQLATILFEHHTDPNTVIESRSVASYIKTAKMKQLFIDNGLSPIFILDICDGVQQHNRIRFF